MNGCSRKGGIADGDGAARGKNGPFSGLIDLLPLQLDRRGAKRKCYVVSSSSLSDSLPEIQRDRSS